jgi:hypothetical protein
MEPGELYWADLPVGRRPIAHCLTRGLESRQLRGGCLMHHGQLCLSLDPAELRSLHAGEFGLSQDCVAQCEAITFVDKQDLDTVAGVIGTLDNLRMREVIHALGHVFDSDCEPN